MCFLFCMNIFSQKKVNDATVPAYFMCYTCIRSLSLSFSPAGSKSTGTHSYVYGVVPLSIPGISGRAISPGRRPCPGYVIMCFMLWPKPFFFSPRVKHERRKCDQNITEGRKSAKFKDLWRNTWMCLSSQRAAMINLQQANKKAFLDEERYSVRAGKSG